VGHADGHEDLSRRPCVDTDVDHPTKREGVILRYNPALSAAARACIDRVRDDPWVTAADSNAIKARDEDLGASKKAEKSLESMHGDYAHTLSSSP
jgi:hypothetical protein